MQKMYEAFTSVPELQAALYHFSIEGLHDELRKWSDLTADSAWCLAKEHAKEKRRFEVFVAKDLAFRFVENFSHLSMQDKLAFIEEYIQWIENTFMKAGDHFHAIMYFNKVMATENLERLNLSENFLTQLKNAYVEREEKWPEVLQRLEFANQAKKAKLFAPILAVPELIATPQVIVAPISPIENESETDTTRVNREINDWLDKIALAIKQRKIAAKKTTCDAQDLLGIEKYILKRFQESSQKNYPNVLEAIESLLKLSPSMPLYFKLADIYMKLDVSQAKRIYLLILAYDPDAFEAYVALAEMAFNQNQLTLVKHYLESLSKNSAYDVFRERLSSLVEQRQAEWSTKLLKIRKTREALDFSKMGATIKECEAFIRGKEDEDIYGEAMLELGLLRIFQEQKSGSKRTAKEFDDAQINVAGYVRAIDALQIAKNKMPDSFEAIWGLAQANKMAGKRFQVVIDNQWVIKRKTLEESRHDLEAQMQLFFSQAKENLKLASTMTHHPKHFDAMWELANLQELAGEYKSAEATYMQLIDSPSYSLKARVKLATLNIKMNQFGAALGQYRSLLDEPGLNEHIVSKSKLYFDVGQIAVRLGMIQEAKHFYQQAKLQMNTSPCYDVEGLQLLLFSADRENYVASVQNFIDNHPFLKYLPALVKQGNTFYLHDFLNDKIDPQRTELGDLCGLMSEYGINNGLDTVLFLQKGDYSRLFYHLETKKGWEHPIKAWKTILIEAINEKLSELEQSLKRARTSENPNRFSCAPTSENRLTQEEKEVALQNHFH